MKKICTFFGLLISMCLLLNVGFSSLSVKGAAAGNTEQTSDPNFTNLIVFARFADEDEFVDDIYQGVSVREIIDNSYNTAYYSVGDYYRNASSDKLRMNSLYLFDNGGSLQLKHERGYYAGYSADNPIGYKTITMAARHTVTRIWIKTVTERLIPLLLSIKTRHKIL